jgi:hypothetical protein
VAFAAILAGCGASIPPPPPSALDTPPPTEWDPPTYTPEPQREARTGAPVGVTVSGGYDQARHVALTTVRALRSADEAVLEELLTERVSMVFPRIGHQRLSRVRLLQAIQHNARRLSQSSRELSVDELVDLSSLEVRSVSRLLDGRATPPGLEPGDLRVLFVLTRTGRRLLAPLVPGWSSRGAVVVRPGSRPRVVGL